MLVPTWMGTNMADGNQHKHVLPTWSRLDIEDITRWREDMNFK